MINKANIKRSFSRAADTYDSYSDVQSEVARHLLASIPRQRYDIIMDIGCGTGTFTRMLADIFKPSRIIAVDMVHEMISRTKSLMAGYHNLTCLEADAEELTCEDVPCLDLIASSGVFHWFSDLNGMVHRCRQMLRPGGVIACALFGSNSLFELENVLEEVAGQDALLPPHTFPDEQALVETFSASFPDIGLEKRVVKRTYPDLKGFLTSLKKTGVAPKGKKRVLFRSRAGLRKIEQRYTNAYGGIVATYEVFFILGRKQ